MSHARLDNYEKAFSKQQVFMVEKKIRVPMTSQDGWTYRAGDKNLICVDRAVAVSKMAGLICKECDVNGFSGIVLTGLTMTMTMTP